MDFFGDELPIEKSSWRARDASVYAETAKYFKANTGTAINADAWVVTMRTAVETKIEPLGAVLVGLEAVMAIIIETQIDVFSDVANNKNALHID